jgi:hypothetical protein
LSVYFIIGEADDAVAPVLEPFGTDGIVFFLHSVGISVYLNDKFVFGTVKVNDETINGMLATKFQAIQLLAPQVLPQFGFGRRLGLTQLTGAPSDDWMNAMSFLGWHRLLLATPLPGREGLGEGRIPR